ncbi:ECF-type riboflavin transporter substrate-binding protein [Bacillota bacterium Meth-B3]|nr:ECF-type riboflavin transporter substrate-binding protein [Christensenellaceae bacterium]MEA5066761.1 ECF-type riboflavin transporter substrate-binding protein [Eubacteriales bacterium]MEA5068415.1 ECF-type riboflavin transporter substrate-binding protein [Christensenellaceae bacterium]
MFKKSPIVTIVAIGIGAALFFVLARFVAIPSPVPNTNISIQYALLGFMSVLFGPMAGLAIGFIGHMLADMSFGYGIWWSWVITSGVAGFLMGFAGRNIELTQGAFDKRAIVRFNLWQVVAHAVSWFALAPLLDILIFAEPAAKVFTQGLMAGVANIITTGILGTLLLMGYASARPAKGSLSKQ